MEAILFYARLLSKFDFKRNFASWIRAARAKSEKSTLTPLSLTNMNNECIVICTYLK